MFTGEPYSAFQVGVDPGIRRQIFNPVKEDSKGRFILNGITALDHKSCSAKLNSEVITNANGFKKNVEDITKFGTGINTDIFKGSAALHFSKSRTTKDVIDFFTKEKGVITMTYAHCITASIAVDYFAIPEFKPGFKNAIYFLAQVSDKPKSVQMRCFKRFIQQYGTHYMSQVEMGAEIMETNFLTSKVRQQFTRQTLTECARLSASLGAFGTTTEGSFEKCKKLLESRNQTSNELVKKMSFVVRGSSPPKDGSVTSWANQVFTPVPLRMELESINNLFSDYVLNHQGISIDGASLRKWFVPMLAKYCEVSGIGCTLQGGCGYQDNCKLEEECVVNGGLNQTYKCVGKNHQTLCCLLCGRLLYIKCIIKCLGSAIVGSISFA